MVQQKINYHPNFYGWQQKACLDNANYTCENCGIKRGESYQSIDGDISPAVIQVAHLNHDPWNPDPELMALCKACHCVYDKEPRLIHRLQTAQREKHQKQIEAGAKEMWKKAPLSPHTKNPNQILYNPDGSYSFYGEENDPFIGKVLLPDTAAYYAWLSNIKSFYFSGREGSLSISRRNDSGSWQVSRLYSRYGTSTCFSKNYKTVSELSCVALELCAKELGEKVKIALSETKKQSKQPVIRKEKKGKRTMIKDTMRPIKERIKEYNTPKHEREATQNTVELKAESPTTEAPNESVKTQGDEKLSLEFTMQCFQPWNTPHSCTKYDEPIIHMQKMRYFLSDGHVEIGAKCIYLIYGDWILYKNGVPIRVFTHDALQMTFGEEILK
jgi:hypothetical protein